MHTCRWIPETGPGIEHLVLRRDGEAIVAEGAVVGGGPQLTGPAPVGTACVAVRLPA
jgi:hypothetical protein